jgi:SAM-dependent methyltransferase
VPRISSRRPKIYDRAYFDRWYRNPRTRIHRRGALERPVATVLDVGCGEGPWQPVLRRLRPRVRYAGVDSSEFAVRRWGRRRGLRLGSFGALAALGFEVPFDLIVCSDVLHYVPTAELRPGLAELRRLLGGLAWIEVFTSSDSITGDFREMRRRSPAFYSRLFRAAGLVPCGLYSFIRDDFAPGVTVFEKGRIQ